MKTTSRKRLLVSSVAMLLVAMLALGTATYAWFTSNTSATASQLSVKTIKSSELKVSDNSDAQWTDQLNYNVVGKVLKPASSADGINWFTASADDKTSYAADNGTIDDISTNLEGYVFKNQLNVQNAGAAAVENVTISFSLTETEAAATGKYVRLALVEADKRGADATLVGTFNVTEPDGKKVVFAAGEDTAEALISEAGDTETVAAASGASGSISVGTLAASGQKGSTKYYNLYIWFEGQDTDCKDAAAGNSMPNITFSVSGDTVNQVG